MSLVLIMQMNQVCIGLKMGSQSDNVLSITQHIELNRSGWWDKTTQTLIHSYLLDLDKDVSLESLCKGINSVYMTRLDMERIRHQLGSLIERQTVLVIDENLYRLSESQRQRMITAKKKTELRDEEVKNRFISEIESREIKIESGQLWEDFNNKFLIPLIKSMGAKTYELVTGNDINIERLSSFQDFLNNYDELNRFEIREAVVAFFDIDDPNLRSYIHQFLNTIFFIESSSLSDTSIKYLGKLMKKKPSFKVFVDTNFLFFLLGLDDSGFKEAADLLKTTVDQLSSTVDIKLYVTNPTIKEAREKLAYDMRKLSSIRPADNLSYAAVRSRQLTGIREKYFSHQQQLGKKLSADEYFRPYIENMISVLRSCGLELYNSKKIEEYLYMPKVVSDIKEQKDAQVRFDWKNKKSDAVLEHDCALWHFASDLRPVGVNTPVESIYWIVTTDFGMINFDRHKRRDESTSTPIAILPTNLIQMLQFWVPRTTEFEQAILSSIRPLLTHSLDPDTEQTTIDILSHLSTYEVDSWSKEVVLNTLTNKTLRQRIRGDISDDERQELVKETVIDHLESEKRKLESETRKKDKELAIAQESSQFQENELKKLRQKIEEIEQKNQELQRENTRWSETVDEFQYDRDQMVNSVAELESRILRREQFNNFIWKIIVFPTLITILLYFTVGYLVIRFADISSTPFAVAYGVFVFVTSGFIFRRIKIKGSNIENVRDTWGFKFFQAIYLFGATVMGLVASGIIGGAAWDGIKFLWQSQ